VSKKRATILFLTLPFILPCIIAQAKGQVNRGKNSESERESERKNRITGAPQFFPLLSLALALSLSNTLALHLR
jgi:hypothetical protein